MPREAILVSARTQTDGGVTGEVRTVERAQRQPGTAGADGPAAPDGPTGCTLELLVHGVGGTTPETMLDAPRTVRITGDDTAAVFRRADCWCGWRV